MYALKKRLAPPIDYFRHCFSCTIEANKGKVEGLKTALPVVVIHAVNEHSQCGDWCNFKEDSEKFRHKYLPGRKPLPGRGGFKNLNFKYF